MKIKQVLPLLKATFSDWNDHNAPRLGAALAFYTILSLSPLVILVLSLVGFLFDRSTAQAHIVAQFEAMIGSDGGKAVQTMLTSAQKPSSGIIGSIIGIITLLFGASGVFGELRSALNLMWDVTPKNTSGVMGMLRERFFSFGMVLSIGFLMMVSLLLSTALAIVGKFFAGLLPLPAMVIAAMNFVVAFVGIAILFAVIFKFVPETKISWRNVRTGAVVTALLFMLGKSLIGLYLSKAGVGSSYGAAGSLIVVIVWVYYSAQIFFFGAEFTHVYAQSRDPNLRRPATPPASEPKPDGQRSPAGYAT